MARGIAPGYVAGDAKNRRRLYKALGADALVEIHVKFYEDTSFSGSYLKRLIGNDQFSYEKLRAQVILNVYSKETGGLILTNAIGVAGTSKNRVFTYRGIQIPDRRKAAIMSSFSNGLDKILSELR